MIENFIHPLSCVSFCLTILFDAKENDRVLVQMSDAYLCEGKKKYCVSDRSDWTQNVREVYLINYEVFSCSKILPEKKYMG